MARSLLTGNKVISLVHAVVVPPCAALVQRFQKPLAGFVLSLSVRARASSSSSGIMALTIISKRICLAQHCDPLSDAGILQHILGYVCPGVWLYNGAVSTLWEECYEQVALDRAVHDQFRRQDKGGYTEPPCETTYRAVFESVATLTWACASGLKLDEQNPTHSRKLQYAAGRHADLPTLIVAHEHGLPMTGHVFAGAVSAGREPVVDYLYTTHHCPMANDIGYSPARKGNTSMLRYLKERGYNLKGMYLCGTAASAGQFETLKYLRSEGCPWWNNIQIVNYAAESGNLEMVQWVLQHENAPLNADAMTGAARSGSLVMCNYLLSRQCPMDASAYAAAAYKHHFNVLNWLYEHDCPMSSGACTTAIYRRHFDVLCWLYEHGCRGDARTCYAAAARNRLDTLRWLRERGCPWEAEAYTEPAYYGYLDVLRYMHEQGCPWDATACDEAARGGQLEALRYLHEHGCPWDAVKACELAVTDGAIDVIEYIVKQDSLVFTAAQLTSMLNAAGRFIELETAQWLREQGAEWPAVLVYSERFGARSIVKVWPAEALTWAREQGCTSPTSTN
eukprot:9107-Heterococcus_DN1.PRE.2